MGVGFDAAQVAAEERARGTEDVLASVVGQALGAASACWENLEGAGVFESVRCRAVLENLLGWLRPQLALPVAVADLAAGDRLLLVAPDGASVEDVQQTMGSLSAFLAGEDSAPVRTLAGAQVVVVRGSRSAVLAGSFVDGCVGEHAPGANPGCDMAAAGQVRHLSAVADGADGADGALAAAVADRFAFAVDFSYEHGGATAGPFGSRAEADAWYEAAVAASSASESEGDFTAMMAPEAALAELRRQTAADGRSERERGE